MLAAAVPPSDRPLPPPPDPTSPPSDEEVRSIYLEIAELRRSLRRTVERDLRFGLIFIYLVLVVVAGEQLVLHPNPASWFVLDPSGGAIVWPALAILAASPVMYRFALDRQRRKLLGPILPANEADEGLTLAGAFRDLSGVPVVLQNLDKLDESRRIALAMLAFFAPIFASIFVFLTLHLTVTSAPEAIAVEWGTVALGILLAVFTSLRVERRQLARRRRFIDRLAALHPRLRQLESEFWRHF